MILIRGIRGHEHAKKIERGLVSCRDLLSTVVSAETSGYVYAGYYERYFMTAFKQLYKQQEEKDHTALAIHMALSDFIPEMYITYFHILNDESEKWLEESFTDDYEFIYYIPKIDKFTGELINKDYTGQKVRYVDQISNEEKDQKQFISHWPLTLMNQPDIDAAYVSSILATSYNALLYPLFQRVKDQKFGEIENEFRIIKFNMPFEIDQNFNITYKNPRTFRVSINGNKYNGHIVKYTQTPFPLEKRDMILTAENPLFVRQNESLMYLYSNGARISFESQFCDLDLKSMSSEYGYIGGKNDCLNFIKKARNSKYYCSNDTKTIIRFRHIDINKQPPKYHWMPPYSYVDYSEEKM